MSEKNSPDGEDEWAAVEFVANAAEGALVAGFLESHEIPARVLDQSFHQTPAVADEDLTRIEVQVPADRAAEARRTLEKRERQFRAIKADDDAILTDEGPSDIEPND